MSGRVNRCLGVGLRATGVGELVKVAGLEVVVESKRLFVSVIVGDMAREFAHALHLRYGLPFLGREVRVQTCTLHAFWLSGIDNLCGAVAGFLPTVLVFQFLAFGRVFFEVTRSSYGIGFLFAFKNNFPVVVAVLLLTVYNAVFFNCSVDFIERNL